MDSFPRLVMSLPEEFEIVENNEEELEDGYCGGAVGSDFKMCKEKAKTCKSCFTCDYEFLHQSV